MVDRLMNGLVNWLAEKVVDLLSGLLAFLTSSVFLSPDVTVLPQVQTIAGKSALVVNVCYILAIITAGIVAMVGGSVEIQYGVKELVPRLVVGFILSNFALPLCSVLIEVANALTVSMVGTAAPTSQAVSMAKTHVASALTDPSTALLALIIGLLIVFLFFALLFGWFVRVGVLVILAGLAPLALACYCLPYTQPVAALWWRTLLGCLGTAALQAIVFSTGIQLLIDPNSSLPVLLGLPGSDIVNLLLVVVVLWTTVKIPGLMRKFVTHQGNSTNAVGLVLRTVAVQSLTRNVFRRVPAPAQRIDMSTHTHHHYRRLRRVFLNGG
ncbi:conjugal transfer protein TrbL family protein [Micromonospora sp. CPCC 206061]|uniref:conjugal transfer protein TrbL family protein n=1 Tax=Micromonospora sp. CPCC 206061 TaxID=3122410 RepID=UPI002FF1F838